MADETATADEPTPARVLNHLFLAAKEKDEFEYVCALLRIRGMEDPGWDRLEETATLVREMLSLISTPLLPHTRIRLGLLVYCSTAKTARLISLQPLLPCRTGSPILAQVPGSVVGASHTLEKDPLYSGLGQCHDWPLGFWGPRPRPGGMA